MAPFVQQDSADTMTRLRLSHWFQHTAQKVRALVADSRGAMTSEYVVVVGTVSLLLVGALVSVGPLLLASYERSRALLIAPFP
jgi:Flp pilus assembly pilin Flp